MKSLLFAALVLLAPFGGAPASAQNEEAAMQSVLVKPGDTLWSIAHRYLKDPARWDEIVKHNRLPTSDPTVALPGMTLKVPIKLLKPSLRAAHLIYALNRVLFRRTESAEWNDAALDMDLFQGDTLRTLEASKARVRFMDKELLNLDPNSMAVIKPMESEGDVELRAGSVFTAKAKVVTANARVTPRTSDTRYSARVERDLSTRVEVYAGKAGVEAQGKEVEVLAGMQTRVAPGLAPENPRPVDDPAGLAARAKDFETGKTGQVKAPKREAAPDADSSGDGGDASSLRKDLDSMSVGVPILGYHIQAARDREFHEVLFDRRYDKEEVFTPSSSGLETGTYWWRTAMVDLLGTEGPYGTPKRYSVVASKAPAQPAALLKTLTVNAPQEGVEVNSDSIFVSGSMRDDRLRLEINGKPARLDADGNFSLSVPLKPGVNQIDFVVTDGRGGSARVQRHVRRL